MVAIGGGFAALSVLDSGFSKFIGGTVVKVCRAPSRCPCMAKVWCLLIEYVMNADTIYMVSHNMPVSDRLASGPVLQFVWRVQAVRFDGVMRDVLLVGAYRTLGTTPAMSRR